MPVVMDKPQAVVIGSKVYVGGGVTDSVEDRNQVFQYDLSHNEWSRLPSHQVKVFAMAQFKGHLITVGGKILRGGYTGKVYHFKEQSQKWEEFIKPMLTARSWPSVATTQSAIVASGGGSLMSRMAMVCSVLLWRCTAVTLLSGTLLTHYLYLVGAQALSPSQTPGTNWGEVVLMTKL